MGYQQLEFDMVFLYKMYYNMISIDSNDYFKQITTVMTCVYILIKLDQKLDATLVVIITFSFIESTNFGINYQKVL